MSVPKFSGGKTAPIKKNKQSVLREIDFSSLIKRSYWLVKNNLKYLLLTGMLVSLTGGQSITLNSSLFGSLGGGGSDNNSPSSNPIPSSGNQSFDEILKNIQDQENIKNQIRDFLDNKEQIASLVWVGIFLLVLMIAFGILVFLYNCHLNFLLLSQIESLEKKEIKDRQIIKTQIRGKWKKVALLRLLFAGLKLVSLLFFFSPTLFFLLQKDWGKAILFGSIAIFAIIFVFIFLSYVYRYSFFYFFGGNLSLKESIDRGHELFTKKWKQTVLASGINFAIHFVASIGATIALIIFLLACLLLGGVIGLIIFLVAGKAYLAIIIITLGIILVLTPTLLFAIILSAVWQSYVVAFWFLFFKEIAGVKIEEIPVADTVIMKGKKKVTEAINKEI